jgi:hypothetical protein
MANLNDAIAANRDREAAKRDVRLASGKIVTHTRHPDGAWLVDQDLTADEWLQYVGLVKGRISDFANEADREDFDRRR